MTRTQKSRRTARQNQPDGREAEREPRWWIRDIVIAGIVALITGGMIAGTQVYIQSRLDTEAADRAERLENLRFVRERSTADPYQPRPFRGIDLTDQTVSGLYLPNADFHGAILVGADLSNTTLRDADLREADFADSKLYGVDLRGADLRMAKNLDSAKHESHMDEEKGVFVMAGICWDKETQWPEGFTPPQMEMRPIGRELCRG
ncbi:pentapeptide repeat-containing protein [Streptomyces sp. 900116325]